ncbi:hypothetical protein ECANGB1_286 [Enterospora canceri]|uniref:Uncharacterized protein n=1 Tax=Enterospora canceri TaxID=1081671 RepID=A0A1Y1S4G2_9MICR|nr:hypothetical protein ECANGB1_340 [Enterospora canceri]ORD93300.1 hypothetical protein ECANGB1_286 [Enterospora canceri]
MYINVCFFDLLKVHNRMPFCKTFAIILKIYVKEFYIYTNKNNQHVYLIYILLFQEIKRNTSLC